MGRPKIDYHLQDVVDKALEYTAEATGVSVQEMQGRSRKQKVVRARFIYEYILIETTPIALRDIGGSINRDHTTVLNGYDRIKDLFISDKDFMMQTLTALDRLEEYIDNRENILNFKTL